MTGVVASKIGINSRKSVQDKLLTLKNSTLLLTQNMRQLNYAFEVNNELTAGEGVLAMSFS